MLALTSIVGDDWPGKWFATGFTGCSPGGAQGSVVWAVVGTEPIMRPEQPISEEVAKLPRRLLFISAGPLIPR